MKIIWVLGGLGNQIFQYALYKKLETLGNNVKLDITDFKSYYLHNGYELENVFNIKADYSNKEEVKKLKGYKGDFFIKFARKINIASKQIDKRFNINISEKILNRLKEAYSIKFETDYIQNSIIKKGNFIETRGYGFKDEVLKLEPNENFYLKGYWQSEKYFKDISNIIKRELKFKDFNDEKNMHIRHKILGTNSISVHIRRGDYLMNPFISTVCTKKYYLDAIELIKNKVHDPIFYFFSDDIKWVKENLKTNNNSIYIDWNKGEKSWIDMNLMSLCKHNIIANSSFSWWGAWLNDNLNKIVIAPNKWSNNICYNVESADILPEEWLKL